MKRLILAALLSLLGIVALNARDAEQSLRVELAKRQRSSEYSLVDVWAGEVDVVSVEDRTAKRVKARDIQKLESGQCSSPDGGYSVFHKSGLSLSPDGKWVGFDAHDWVQQICKPGRSFIWVRNSDLLFDRP